MSRPTPPAAFEEAIALLRRIIADDLRHGYFECDLRGHRMTGGQRELVIKNGKTYRFRFSLDELRQCDPRDGGASAQEFSRCDSRAASEADPQTRNESPGRDGPDAESERVPNSFRP